MLHQFLIVGAHKADAEHGDVSWISPIARGVFLRRHDGDEVKLPTPATSMHPAGVDTLEILEITYTDQQPVP
ncbi:GreA/GreB family elongation factor [Sutterella wadsworthensis]|uniref:GreA/GreB family elongation factor n=1 Tax=Sutterella wadsworthensis TaxID=40545 RepID=UPI00241CF10B|nr:GreA/GreB family elongation factor [Sutterella wadsworthensis]